MGRRSRKRDRAGTGSPPATTGYTDSEGAVLTLRDSLSAGTVRQLAKDGGGKAAASQDDMWQRRGELLFERLAVSWEISGLPLTGQKELLGRYRMADGDTRRWVRETLEQHLSARYPELQL